MNNPIRKNIIYKNRFTFLAPLIISWLFVFGGIFANYIPGILFFGLCAIIQTYPLLDPKTKIIFTGTREYKEHIKNDFQERLIDQGIFTYADNGFEVMIEGQNHTIDWTDIQAMFGYKADLYTIDEIRLDIFCNNNISFTISEEVAGWYVFLEKIIEQFPDIKQNWNLEIAFPAFSANLTLVYEKHNKTLEEAVDYYYKKTES